MEVGQFYYFRTIVEQGSLNKAAEVLCVSRQGLTKIIRKMEQELGVQLFDVAGTGAVLTLFAEALYERSVDYIQFPQDFLSKVYKLKQKRTNELVIGLQA